jgi:hypothetical protein
MEIYFVFLIIIFALLFFYYIFNHILLIKNVKEEYVDSKFKIWSLGIFTIQKYFNEQGKKYLIRVRLLVIILGIYGFILLLLFFY